MMIVKLVRKIQPLLNVILVVGSIPLLLLEWLFIKTALLTTYGLKTLVVGAATLVLLALFLPLYFASATVAITVWLAGRAGLDERVVIGHLPAPQVIEIAGDIFWLAVLLIASGWPPWVRILFCSLIGVAGFWASAHFNRNAYPQFRFYNQFAHT